MMVDIELAIRQSQEVQFSRCDKRVSLKEVRSWLAKVGRAIISIWERVLR